MREIEGPAVVAVAREHHEVCIRALRRSEQPCAGRGEAGPRVEVEAHAELGGRDADARAALEVIGRVRRHPLERALRHDAIAHHGLLGDHLPALAGAT